MSSQMIACHRRHCNSSQTKGALIKHTIQQAVHGYSTHVPFDLLQGMPIRGFIPFLSMLWSLLDGIHETQQVTHCNRWQGNCFPLPACHCEASVELNGGMEYWNELWPQSSTQLHKDDNVIVARHVDRRHCRAANCGTTSLTWNCI